MAIRYARLGISLTLLFIVPASHADEAGELLSSGITSAPDSATILRGDRFGHFNPAADTGNRHETSIDGGRQRIESDLLILPVHYQTLATNRPNAVAAARVADTVDDCKSAATARIADGMPV